MDRKLYQKPESWWKDKVVVPNRDITSVGKLTILKGTPCEITRKYRGFGIRTKEPILEEDGVKRHFHITRVQPDSLDFAEPLPAKVKDVREEMLEKAKSGVRCGGCSCFVIPTKIGTCPICSAQIAEPAKPKPEAEK